MNIVANLAYVRKTQEVVELRNLSTDGPRLSKALGLLGGVMVATHQFYGLVSSFSSLPSSSLVLPLLVLHQSLSLFLSLATILLECRSVLCSLHMHKKTREYFKFLSYLWGRGLLYLFTGAILSLRFLPFSPTSSSPFSSSSSPPPFPPTTLVDMLSSLYFTLLGLFLLLLSLHYHRRLSSSSSSSSSYSLSSSSPSLPPSLLPHTIPTIDDPLLLLRSKFARADIYSQGKIPSTDLATICAELGSRLSHQELEGAILTLDANRNGEVAYDDFVEWWRGR